MCTCRPSPSWCRAGLLCILTPAHSERACCPLPSRAQGQPILRLRADAVHTANLKRDAKCSLFVQPGEHPARLLARVTLIGAVEPVSEGRHN